MKTGTATRMMGVLVGLVMGGAGAMAQDAMDGAAGDAIGDSTDKVIVSGFASTQPSRAHEHYEPIVGDWDSVWMFLDNDGNATRTIKGSATNEWIIGGRWVQSTFTTDLDMAGEKFHGIGLFGHDNTTGIYHNVWFENNRTAVQYDKGSYDAKTRTFTFEGKQPGPDGKRFIARTTLRIDSADQHTIELYVVRSKDNVAKVLEMVLTRVQDGADDEHDDGHSDTASPEAR